MNDRDWDPIPPREVAQARERLLRGTATLIRAEVRRREGRGPQPTPGWPVIRTIGRIGFTALFGILIAIMVVLGVGGIVSLGEPVYWGTFTEERCERARFGCRPVGTWVSDSGDLRVDEVQLDGAVGPDGTARASYRPTGFNDDADNAIVHAEPWASWGPWMPWIGAVVFGWVLGTQWWQWRSSTLRARL